MKFFLIILFVFTGGALKAQEKTIVIPYKPADLLFYNEDSLSFTTKHVIGATIGKITYTKVPNGFFKIYVTGPGQDIQYLDSITVHDSSFTISIIANGPCLYNHPKNYIPICPRNHEDNILKIVYGLIPDLDENKYYRGGCVVSDCDPKYFCKIHRVEF